jgi:Fe-S-cluster-containing hydrogenase component 2
MYKVSDLCYRCGDCIKACPVPGTITNILPGKVLINDYTCISCNQCVVVCRFSLITKEQEEPAPDLLALAETFQEPNATSNITPEQFAELYRSEEASRTKPVKKNRRRK